MAQPTDTSRRPIGPALLLCLALVGCGPIEADPHAATDGGAMDRGSARDARGPLTDTAPDGPTTADMAPDARPEDAARPDAEPLDADRPRDMTPDRGRLDATPPDAIPPDATPPDAIPPDAALPDAALPDAAPPTGLHIVDTRPPRIGWVRQGQAELSGFDPATGPGPPAAFGPPGVDAARFVALDGAIHLVWSDPDGVWLGADNPRPIADGALRGLTAQGSAIVALTTHADPQRARLVRVDPALGPQADIERIFDVAPDARELLGVAATADTIGVLTGDARADGLDLHRFDPALDGGETTPICDFGCDRPRARLVGGPDLAALYQSTGQLHRVIGDARDVLGDVVRGGPIDLRHDGRWVAVWTTPADRRPGVTLDGVLLHDGPVREVALLDGDCAVWLDPTGGVGWGCR